MRISSVSVALESRWLLSSMYNRKVWVKHVIRPLERQGYKNSKILLKGSKKATFKHINSKKWHCLKHTLKYETEQEMTAIFMKYLELQMHRKNNSYEIS